MRIRVLETGNELGTRIGGAPCASCHPHSESVSPNFLEKGIKEGKNGGGGGVKVGNNELVDSDFLTRLGVSQLKSTI